MADNNMSYEEAGKKGGEQTAENHSKEFYQDIGEKGGDQRLKLKPAKKAVCTLAVK